MRTAVVLFLLAACTSAEQDRISRTVVLTVENETGGQMWEFDYRECGSSQWFYVIDSDEYVANGDPVSTRELSPGCYELYVEDEYGCYADTDTDGNVKGGQEFTWTVRGADMVCYGFF
jgi:hypothetical protein